MRSEKLNEYIASVVASFEGISEERKKLLKLLASTIDKLSNGKNPVNLILICTHNSRRSHLSQVWAQVAAHYYGFRDIHTYSGGTEATAMFPEVGKTFLDAGLGLFELSEGNNPVYAIKYDNTEAPIIAFSKPYHHEFNPFEGYIAIMTCDHADANCPVIPEAGARLSLPYEDPKAFDNSPQQAEKYRERSFQIATELFYAFSLLKTM